MQHKAKGKGVPITGHEVSWGMWMQEPTYKQPTALGRGRVPSPTVARLYSQGKDPGTHFIGGWVNPKTSLDTKV